MSLLHHFGNSKYFSHEKGIVTFFCLLKPNFMQKSQKKVFKQSFEKGGAEGRTGRTGFPRKCKDVERRFVFVNKTLTYVHEELQPLSSNIWNTDDLLKVIRYDCTC